MKLRTSTNMNSQNQDILEYLLAGNSLTPLECLNRFGSLRASARIKNLRDLGYNIETEMVSSNGKRYANYRISKQTLF